MGPRAFLGVAWMLLATAPAAAEPVPERWQVYESPGLGLRFDVPAEGCAVREETHRPDDPDRQISHAVAIACGGPDLLRVDMWLAPGGDAASWFHEHLGFLEPSASRVASERQSRLDLAAVVAEFAASPQVRPRRIIALGIEGRVYVLSIEHADEPLPQAILEHVLATLEAAGSGAP